jgi:hypothetical protein
MLLPYNEEDVAKPCLPPTNKSKIIFFTKCIVCLLATVWKKFHASDAEKEMTEDVLMANYGDEFA